MSHSEIHNAAHMSFHIYTLIFGCKFRDVTYGPWEVMFLSNSSSVSP